MIENLDWNLGRAVMACRGLDLAESARLAVFSDHGDLHGSHSQFRKTAPWEEAIRVPCILTNWSTWHMTGDTGLNESGRRTC